MHLTLNLIVALLFIVPGGAVVVSSIWELVQAFGSARWLRADGVILCSKIQRSSDGDSGNVYRADISYAYNVAGNDLVGARPRFGSRGFLSWSGPAERMTEKYRVGARVTVWYDPEDPRESVLETGMTTLAWGGLACGATVFAAGVYWLTKTL